MPAQIERGEFCSSYFGTYKVTGSKGDTYTVTTAGGEGPAMCTCKAYEFCKGEPYDRTCKHIDFVWKNACMWNCQWHDGNENPTVFPVSTTSRTIPGSECPNCGHELVPVLIAV